MQSQIKDIDRLMDIHEFASLIIEQVEMITEKEFNNNEVLRWALLKWLENMVKRRINYREKQPRNLINWIGEVSSTPGIFMYISTLISDGQQFGKH
jgi:hypothetical protein